ncbi:CDP-glycerol glycerophosphotransferase family protein [Colwelliaceae bacterium 6471]
MNVIKCLIKISILWPIYWLLKLVPRNNNIWCFSSYRDSFVDNSKYLFHYVSTKHPEIDCYWVTDDLVLIDELKSQGYQALKRKSFNGALMIIRAKYVFYSSYVAEINHWLTSGAKLVNLWHGLPLKKIEFDIDSGVLKNKYSHTFNWQKLYLQLFYPAAYRVADLMFAPTDEMEHIFKRAFRLKDDAIVKCGSPRTDQFFDGQSFSTLTTKDLEQLSVPENRKVYIYMPTFRDTGGDFFSKENFNFEQLNQAMEKVDGEFWIKAHPAAGVENIDLSQYDRIKLLPSNIDMYPVLKLSYALITDYSSIYIDYLLLDKPIYFYCFDLDDYKKNCRSMYFEYDEVTPGEKCQSFELLLSSIEAQTDNFVEHRTNIKRLFWDEDYTLGCKAVIERIR